EIISPLMQQLPKLWELFHNFGMTTLEINPIRMREGKLGRLTPVACDFKCGFDRDDPRWLRLGLPAQLFAADYSAFEQEINALGLPYRLFGFDSDMSEVIQYARRADAWMKAGGRERLATRLGMQPAAVETA